MVKVAIPVYENMVAPRFEATGMFIIIEVRDGQKVSSRTVSCAGPEQFRRIRLLQVHSVNVLICNGIKGLYRDMLRASGLIVISKISRSVDEVLQLFLSGEISADNCGPEKIPRSCHISRDELVNRTIRLFESGGYCVTPGPGHDFFLIDLVAEIKCPLCAKPVKVAICCGAHTYSTDHEIREFHFSTPAEYDARVYVYPEDQDVSRCCREYGIELIDPGAGIVDFKSGEQTFPVLKNPVYGHERAFRQSESKGRSDD